MTIFDTILQIIRDIWSFAEFVWDFLVFLLTNFSAADMLLLALTFFGIFLVALTDYMPAQLQAAVTTASAAISGPIVADLIGIAAYIIDIFIPWVYFDTGLGYLLKIWAIAWIVRVCIKIFGLIWPGAGSD